MWFALVVTSISTALTVNGDEDDEDVTGATDVVDDIGGDVLVGDSICAFNCQFVCGTLW